jgi:apolipoprotein N-acyltransferase
LAPIALAPWIAALFFEEKWSRAILSGLIFGLVFWGLAIPWVSFVVTHFGGQPAWMGAICVFLVALILAEWPMLVGGTLVAAFPARSPWRLAAFPVLWMAAEHARSVAYKGFPWNLTANALAQHPVWLQTASWWGAYGVGALLAAAATTLAGFVLARGRRRLASAALLAFLVAAAGVFGAHRLTEPTLAHARVRVACVQPNIPQAARETVEGAAHNYETVLDAVRRAAASRPDLILVPESSFYGLTWHRSARLRRDLSAIAAESGASILFNDIDEESEDLYFNAARLLTPRGLARATYRKVHLVPFGEYVPLPRLFFFMKSISQAVGSFTAADAPVVLSTDRLSLGPAVCYEMTYPSLARDEVRNGATLLVTISNDAWYGRAGAQEQHFEALVLRAIENDRPFARAAITGISGIVDAKGRVLTKIEADRTGVADAAVTPGAERTVWSRWGAATFPGIADLLSVAMVLSGIVRWRRSRRP